MTVVFHTLACMYTHTRVHTHAHTNTFKWHVCVCHKEHSITMFLVSPPSPSAGIGRTGVFIGADIGMQQLEETGEVDMLKVVSTMRQDRGGMVQTKDQYVFLHQVRSIQK